MVTSTVPSRDRTFVFLPMIKKTYKIYTFKYNGCTKISISENNRRFRTKSYSIGLRHQVLITELE